MNLMCTTGLYSSLINGNTEAAIGYSMMNSHSMLNSCSRNNRYKNPNRHKNKNQEIENDEFKNKPVKKTRVKKTRAYSTPDEEFRCTANTLKGERCLCRKIKTSNYCVFHDKINNPILITNTINVQNEEKKVHKTWRNLFGLLK